MLFVCLFSISAITNKLNMETALTMEGLSPVKSAKIHSRHMMEMLRICPPFFIHNKGRSKS